MTDLGYKQNYINISNYQTKRLKDLREASRVLKFYEWVETPDGVNINDLQDYRDEVAEMTQELEELRFKHLSSQGVPPEVITVPLGYCPTCPVCIKNSIHLHSSGYKPWSPATAHCIHCGASISSVYGSFRALLLTSDLGSLNGYFRTLKRVHFQEQEDGLYVHFLGNKGHIRLRLCESLERPDALNDRINELSMNGTFTKAVTGDLGGEQV